VLVNGYGPTESTTFTTCEVLRDAAELQTATSVAIGKVVGGRRAYVVDERGELVGEGIWGELYIGGAGVGRGYVQRAAETAERFVPDCWSGEWGGRLYRTGDVVRWKGDRRLEFKGRADGQVKLRGYRIEVGEIEAVLLGHGGVREAVVVAREDGNEKSLAAYVMAVTNELSTSDLREYLTQRLPSYMVPAAITLVETLPLTPNGKIDRRSLRELGLGRTEMPNGSSGPRDSLEVQLLTIWEHVLNVRPISVQDNFFSLGGHSLHAVRLISQIHARIGQDLPVAAIFENPTIDQLASVLRERNWPGVLRLVDDLPQVNSPLVSIQPSGAKPPLFFVSALGGILPSNVISSVLDLAPHLERDQPFYGLQLPGLVQPLACHFSSNAPVDDERLAELFGKHLRENPPVKIIRDGAAQCIEALRQIQPAGPYHLVGFCSGGIVALEIANQLLRRGEEVGLLVLMDTATPSSWRQQSGEVAPVIAEGPADPEVKRIGWFICKDLAGSRLQIDLEEVYVELSDHSDNERWEYAAELLKSGGEVALETTGEDIRRLYLIYTINSDSVQFILQRYRPQHYSGPITLFRINDFNEVGDDLSLGWSQFTSEPVDVQIVDGDHGTFFHGENLVTLARRLTTCLEAAYAKFEVLVGNT
jgi:thioesterase domain-containing protein/aryl carrier-like protein